LGQTGWIGCVRFEKINCNFFRSSCSHNGPPGRVSHLFWRPKPKLRKHTRHEFCVKRRGLGAFDWKKSTATCFAPDVARTALGVGFCTSFGDRNRNCENTPDMSFGSNGANWVRSIRKNQLQLFSLHKWPERPSGSSFARVWLTETETAKTHQT